MNGTSRVKTQECQYSPTNLSLKRLQLDNNGLGEEPVFTVVKEDWLNTWMLVECFTMTNALVLNARKCEVVVVSSTKNADVPVCTYCGWSLFSPSTSAKCLGHWWSWDLSSDKAINEVIRKARKCFFAYGFDGQLNPLSRRAIFDACAEPVLLYN